MLQEKSFIIEHKHEKLRSLYRQDEALCLEKLLAEASLSVDTLQSIQKRAREWMVDIRANRLKQGGLDAFLYQYDLSSEEGIALMCLAEALLRIPDSSTIDRLIRDKIASQNWEEHLGKSPSWFVNAATLGLMLTGKVLSAKEQDPKTLFESLKNLMSRTGEPLIREAVKNAMKILGNQFVMGRTIKSALKRAEKWETLGYRYSFDMLGEAAKTHRDAEQYFQSYVEAIDAVGKANANKGPITGGGVSVKLSALHPRYEWTKRDDMIKELLPKLKELATKAAAYDIGLTIDAEEADRLELSLLLIEHLLQDQKFRPWRGFGLAVQAYQKRAWTVIDWAQDLAEQLAQPLTLRLVKGAYWDSEIKWSQEKGLSGYPVFTRKASTDVSYLACAKKLFMGTKLIFPQFATHNAYTAAAILEMAEQVGMKDQFEFQCLHGMGDALYSNIVGPHKLNLPCRIYAPVGNHEYLLGYLVRRLLENGANTSFVNRIIDEETPLNTLIQDPVAKVVALQEKPHPKIPLPLDIYQPHRSNSKGIDLSNPHEIDPVLENVAREFLTIFNTENAPQSDEALILLCEKAHQSQAEWARVSPDERAQRLETLGQLCEKNKARLLALLIREGGKTVQDAISEVREAIDFTHYYAWRGRQDFDILRLPGPTGEYNQLTLHGRGMMACISPWNFPLAIFLGQVTGALMAGNTVIAKPASQTPLIAKEAVRLMHEAGFPKEVVELAVAKGSRFGNTVLTHRALSGVMFTGSTETARGMNQVLANRAGPIVPFIAETGGQNVMIVDSSALPEQVVTDVVTSAFNSAGQRCSALRVLFVQQDIADRVITLLQGAMEELKLGDPFDLSVDVGPVIDQNACIPLQAHSDRMSRDAKLIYQCPLPSGLPSLPRGVFFAPRAFEIPSLDLLKQEVFGPLLHVIRYRSQDLEKVLSAIQATGYGLTLGIHSRIAETVEYIASRAQVGNMYVNRNMIGAVVGVQPFGGEGLSGTGPKAGGPHILPRLAHERCLSINVAATGGNADLMSLAE